MQQTTTYSLYLLPRGQLWKLSDSYYNDVVGGDLYHKDFAKWGKLHCTLTSFFSKSDLRDKGINMKKALIDAMKKAKKGKPDINIKNLSQKAGLHKLDLNESEYLRRVTDIFAKKVGLSKSKIKDPSHYHITLAHRDKKANNLVEDEIFKTKEKNNQIKKLEGELLKEIKEKKLMKNGKWAIGLVKMENGEVKSCGKKIPILRKVEPMKK